MPEFAPVLVVSELDGSNGFRLDGDVSSDYSGRVVAGGGDVNGDGFADFLVAAVFPVVGYNRGLVWVVFGQATSPAAASLADQVAAGSAYRLRDGPNIGDVTHAGDVNGDGFDDLFIGATTADPDATRGNRGASYLVFGGVAKLESADAADGTNDNLIALASLKPATGFRFDGVANNDHSGHSVSGAGDVNGDGIADLVIGAPAADPDGGFSNGASYIVFGGTANLTDLDNDDGRADGRIDLVNISVGQGLRLDGRTNNAFDLSGVSVALVGDVNGDGFDDALVGAQEADPNSTGAGLGDTSEGAAWLFFGRSQAQFTVANLKLASLAGLDGTRFDGAATGDRAGAAVAGLGDVNGDGFDDIAIGAPYAEPGGNIRAGSAYVVFGRSSFAASSDLASLTGANGFRLDGLRQDEQTGISVSAAGDINGDGFADILVGAPNFSRIGAGIAGAAYVVFGKASGFAAVIDRGSLDGDSGFRIEGAAEFNKLGFSVAAAGDVNGDGFDDLVVGAYDADSNLHNTGATYIIYGHRAETAVTRTGTALDNHMNGGKGADSVSGLGGFDTLFGWEEDDILNGGEGADRLTGGDGADTLDGGRGGDTASYLTSLSGIKLALDSAFAADGDAALDTLISIERITGTNFDDTLRGDRHANRLIGSHGDDALSGMAGNDTLLGGRGADILSGGLGDDGFDYTQPFHGGDTIVDFRNLAGNNDSLRFKGAAFGGLAAGALDASRFTANATGLATTGEHRFIYETDTGVLRFDADGTGNGAAIIMATLTGAPLLTMDDFLIL